MATAGFGSGIDPTKAFDNVLRRLEGEVDSLAAAQRRLRDAARRLEATNYRPGGLVPVSGPGRAGGGLRPGPVAPEPSFVPSGRGGGGVVPPIPANEPAKTRALTGARRELNSTTLQQISVMGAANRRTQESGALTSQFLEEMRQGRTTLRQFGDEALATAGKFGGWVAAATAIYGVLGAVGEIGEGAMEGQASVELLKRSVENVDEGQAGARFRSLARHFRIGIGDVGEVAFGLGKVFHDQEEVFKAAEAGLLAVQVADLSPENAHRFLGAIAQGAGLAADELEGVVDIANKLQEAFGAETTGLIEGTAKAAGAWTNAGGQLDFLMALIGVGQAITGASGVEVGTAFKRAPGMVRKADAQRVLAEFGIEGALPLEDIIREALKQAPRLSGEDLRRLGAAIGGPQWGANVITPILARSDLFADAFGTVEGGRAAGSGRSELEKVQKQLQNVLEGIASQLNSIGSILDRTGMLDSFKALIGLLTTTLQIVNLIGEQFAALPAPLRQMVAYAAQFAILLKGLRALNVSEALPDGAVADFLRHPRQREKMLGRALSETDAALGKELASNRTVISRQFRERDLWKHNLAEAEQAAASATTDEAQKAALKAQEQARAEILAIEQRIAQLEVKSAAVLKDQEAAAAARADLKARTLSADAIAAKHGIVMPDALEMAAHREGEQMRRDSYGGQPPVMVYGDWNLGEMPKDPSKTPEQLAKEQTKLGRIGADYRRAMRGLRMQMMRNGGMLKNLGVMVRMAATSIAAAGKAVWAFMGPVGLAFAALLFLPTILDKAGDLLLGGSRRFKAAEQALGQTATTTDEFTQQLNDLLGSWDKENAQLVFTLTEERERALQEIRSGNSNVRFAAGTVFDDDLKKMAEESSDQVESGKKTAQEHIAFLRHLAQVSQNNDLNFREATGALEEAEADEIALIEARGKIALARATTSLEKARITSRIASQVLAAVKASPESSEADILNAEADLVEARAALDAQVEQEARQLAEAKDRLWVSRAGSATQRAVRGVRAAKNALRRVKDDASATAADLVTARQDLEESKRQAADDLAQEAIELGRLRDDLRLSRVSGELARATVEVQNAARHLERVRNNPVSDSVEQQKALFDAQIQYNDALRAYAEQRAQEADDVAGALDRLWVARAGTDLEQARRNMVAAQRALARLRQDPNASKSQIIDAQTAAIEAQRAYNDALQAQAEALRDSRFNLAAARASDNPVRAARVAEREAKALLRDAKTPTDRNNALAQLITSRKQRRDAIAQQRLDDIRFDADMDRITREQEIRMLQHMLDTMKLSKAMRRDLKRQIHQLKKEMAEGDFGLNVGNIRLPTAYEIKRMVRQGGPVGQQPGQNFNTVNNNNNTYNINVETNDPERFGRELAEWGERNHSNMVSAGLVV